MKIVTFVFYDSGEQFISPAGWIPGNLQPGQREVYPGQEARFCANLYRCVVRKGIEALSEGTINLPVFIFKQHHGDTMSIDLEALKKLPERAA